MPAAIMNGIHSGNMACFDDNEIAGPAGRGCHRTFKNKPGEGTDAFCFQGLGSRRAGGDGVAGGLDIR
jgi:hypothetical protein